MTTASPITKKAEKAARVLANKQSAYLTKVQTLVGYAGPRITMEMAVAAMATKDALTYATEIVAQEPVGRAILPLKAQAVEAANKWAHERVAKMTSALEKAGWDLDVVAPHPNYNAGDYKAKAARRARYSRIVSFRQGSHRRGEPHFCDIDPNGVARFVANAEFEAAFEYDAFVCKLVVKVGPCLTATLTGSHVWSHSILTVQKPGGQELRTEHWRTQQITNVSVLGKYFPQWPTRLMKGGV